MEKVEKNAYLVAIVLFTTVSLSLGDGLIYTEILSQRAVKPKAIIQPTKLFDTLMHSISPHMKF